MTTVPNSLALIFIASLAAGFVVACSDAETAEAPAGSTPTSGGAAATGATGATTTDKPAAAPELEGAPITGDGDVPTVVPEAGELAPDGGLVVIPGCLQLSPGGYAASTCSSRASTLANVGLVSATYDLASVTVLGNTTFCSGSFKALEHSGALVVDAISPTQANLRFYERYRSAANVLAVAVNRWSVAAASSGDTLSMALPATCSSGKQAAPATALFGSGTAEGKKYITLVLPYGAAGKARYRFVER